jgi:hypothetical protein
MRDDIDGNRAEIVYQGDCRELSVEESFMFSEDFDIEKETARVLQDIEGYLIHMAQADISHLRKKEICYEALDAVVDLRRFYTDDNYNSR